jgi:hypothetical protein
MTDYLKNAIDNINKLDENNRLLYNSVLLENAYNEIKQMDTELEHYYIMREILIACGKLWAQDFIDF